MVNVCELPVNVVKWNEPKVLAGSAKTARERKAGCRILLSRTISSPAKRQDLTHSDA